MRFASLGSGSRGNATLVEHGGTRILIDCGFSVRETERRLARLGCEAESISAVLVTHEHTDHAGGVARLARRYGIPVWMTPGTWAARDFGALPAANDLNCHESLAIGDLCIEPFPVPHDAREPCQFVFTDGQRRLGLLTDAGRSTQHIEERLAGCDALLLETNHDLEMLAGGDYPPSLKLRVGGGLGHLSNVQAAEVLGRLDCSRLQHVVAAHLSENNNRPALARTALATTLGCSEEWITVADQEHGFDWRSIA